MNKKVKDKMEFKKGIKNGYKIKGYKNENEKIH